MGAGGARKHMSLKYHKVRPLKFHFLFVVLKMVFQTQLCYQKVDTKQKPEGGKVTVCRLCKRCGCMLK